MRFADEELRRSGSLRVLDIGCGAGRNAIPLARLGCDVFGIDLSWPMFRSALERTRKKRPTSSCSVTGSTVSWNWVPAASDPDPEVPVTEHNQRRPECYSPLTTPVIIRRRLLVSKADLRRGFRSPSRSRSMMSSMRAAATASTACGMLAGTEIMVPRVARTAVPPMVSVIVPSSTMANASNGDVCSVQSLSIIERKERDIAARRLREHAARNPVFRWRDERQKRQRLCSRNRLRHRSVLARTASVDDQRAPHARPRRGSSTAAGYTSSARPTASVACYAALEVVILSFITYWRGGPYRMTTNRDTVVAVNPMM